jgi:hypothetical protein
MDTPRRCIVKIFDCQRTHDRMRHDGCGGRPQFAALALAALFSAAIIGSILVMSRVSP